MPKKVIAFLLVLILMSFSFYLLRELMDIRRLQKEVSKIELELKKLPVEEKLLSYLTEGDVPFIVRDLISRLPRDLKFDLKQVFPHATRAEGELRKFGIELEFVSNLTNLKNYLSRISMIKTPAYVDRLAMKSSGTGEVSGRLILSFLLLPGKSTLAGTPETYEVKKVASKRIVRRAEKKPTLQGIWKGKETKAIINDQIVGPGEKVENYKILAIEKNQVILEKDGRKTILRMEVKP